MSISNKFKNLKEYSDYVYIEAKLDLSKENNEQPESPIELVNLMRNILIRMEKQGHKCKMANISSIQSDCLAFYFIVPRQSSKEFMDKLSKVNPDYTNKLVNKNEFENLFNNENEMYSLEGTKVSSWNIVHNMEFVSKLQKSLKNGEHVSTMYNYTLPKDYSHNDMINTQILVSTNTKRNPVQEFIEF